MSRVPLQCGRMAAAAGEYCDLIDSFDGFGGDRSWASQIGKMLPKLHIAVIALAPSSSNCGPYQFPDDDQRCELYMRLHHVLQFDHFLRRVYGKSSLHQQFCDSLADDFADMYFDLRLGLDLFEFDSVLAANMWQCSFYIHWGQHLLDAECRLRAIEVGERPLPIPGWNWPGLMLASN